MGDLFWIDVISLGLIMGIYIFAFTAWKVVMGDYLTRMTMQEASRKAEND